MGSAVVRRLRADGIEPLVASRDELDLRDQAATRNFVARQRPDYIVNAAARVGGIGANVAHPAVFMHDNLAIATNLLQAAHLAGVQRLLFIGSSCIYPRDCPQPIREEYLLTGPLESTNEPYAIAKIAGLKLAQAYNREYGRRYVTIMPTNLYGPGDNFDLENGHVLAALLAKIDSAHREGRDSVEIWGSGTPRREFLYVDDLADACVLLMGNTTTDEMFNVGTGQDLPILELAQRIAKTVGYTGSFVLDRSRPDGTPVKRLDVSRLARLGWRATTTLEEGLARTYDWYCQCRARP